MTTMPLGVIRSRFDPSSPDFPAVLSLLLLVVVVHGNPLRAGVGFLLASVGAAVPGLARRPLFWWMVAIVTSIWYLASWRTLDNHVVLVAYWTAVLALTVGSRRFDIELAKIGRVMVGLVFLLALGWKLRSPDFLSGGFYEWTLLVDPRFSPVSGALGVDASALAANRDLVASGLTGVLQSSPAVSALAAVLTWGTVFLEASVAVTWLATGGILHRLRHWALGGFAVLTYIMVPVLGFGFTLLVMGAASTRRPILRRRYALAAIGLLVYSRIWPLVFL